MGFMAKEKKPSDRHRAKAMQLRLHHLLRQQLELLCERNVSTMTAEIAIALREHLRAAGLWPPTTPPQSKE